MPVRIGPHRPRSGTTVSSMHAPVIVAGEALIDIVTSRTGTAEHVGGSPANVAIGLSRLGHRTRLATHVAHDERGERILAALAEEDVEVTDRSADAERTPTAQANLDDHGAATYTFDLTWEIDPGLEVAPGTHFHTGSIAGTMRPGADDLVTVVERARETGTVSYDPNARPKIMLTAASVLEQIERLAALADVVKASDEDIEWLYDGLSLEDALRRWQGLGVPLGLITRGGDGALVCLGDEIRHVGLGAADVVDTVGAGDSFMAGLISGLLDLGYLGDTEARERLRGASIDDLEPALNRALAAAAITVSRAGANPPRRDELDPAYA